MGANKSSVMKQSLSVMVSAFGVRPSQVDLIKVHMLLLLPVQASWYVQGRAVNLTTFPRNWQRHYHRLIVTGPISQ